MQVTAEVKARVLSKIEDGIKRANEFYSTCTFGMPTVKFNQRGMTAGTATGALWEVNFNPILLMENQDDFIEQTVPHELAHLIDYEVNPINHQTEVKWTRRGYRRTKRNIHGADFKFIVERVLGADDSTRCHNYDVSRAKVKKRGVKYLYRCTCGCNTETTLGPKRHANEQRNPGSYWLIGHGKARLDFIAVDHQKPLTVAASAPKKTTTSHKRSVGDGSIKEQARTIFNQNSQRGTFITTCMERLGMKKTTASTYHYNFNSGKW